MAHGGERASLLFARQRYISHTGMLHATFILADIRAPELLPRGVVQRGGSLPMELEPNYFLGWGRQLPLLHTVSPSSHPWACNCALNLPKTAIPEQMLGPRLQVTGPEDRSFS